MMHMKGTIADLSCNKVEIMKTNGRFLVEFESKKEIMVAALL